MQQVKHEAYLALWRGRAGVLVPEVLAAGRFGPSKDAALVTNSGRSRCRSADAMAGDTAATWPAAPRPTPPWPTAHLDELLQTVLRLRAAGIAHGCARL